MFPHLHCMKDNDIINNDSVIVIDNVMGKIRYRTIKIVVNITDKTIENMA